MFRLWNPLLNRFCTLFLVFTLIDYALTQWGAFQPAFVEYNPLAPIHVPWAYPLFKLVLPAVVVGFFLILSKREYKLSLVSMGIMTCLSALVACWQVTQLVLYLIIRGGLN